VNSLHYQVIPLVTRDVLRKLMAADAVSVFRLVGGTALALQRGHRRSSDIELYTDAKFGTVNFNAVAEFLRREFPYFGTGANVSPDVGKSWFAGNTIDDCCKIDFFYAETFLRPLVNVDAMRLATMEEIAAMKLDSLIRKPQKQDFWDLHALLEEFDLEKMIGLHKKKYHYDHKRSKLLDALKRISVCDVDFDPVNLGGKSSKTRIWELVKLDIVEAIRALEQPTDN